MSDTTAATVAVPPRLRTLDALRGLTILWVTVMHVAADTVGLPGADAGPSALWTALAEARPIEAARTVLRGVLFLPGFRLDVLLFVTGLVLGLGRPRPARVLFSHRARAILPGYWLGTLLVLAVMMIGAAVRAAVGGAPFADELQYGSRLARAPYEFVPGDLILGLTVLGRFTAPAAVQVVSPSLWYIALVAQFYLAYPLMRWLFERLGPPAFLAVCAIVMLAARLAALGGAPLGPFDVGSALAAFLPFRLLSPALGMVAAPWFRQHGERLQRTLSPTPMLAVATALLLLAGWIGSMLIPPVTLLTIVGPSLALVPAVAGLWVVAAWALARPAAGRLLIWAGQASLALLVIQDALRFTVGTVQSLGVPLAPWLWWLLPAYVALALLLTRWWDPVVRGVTDACWPPVRPAAR